MKISLNRLKDFIELTQSPEEIEQMLTGCGLEVEHYTSYASIPGALQGLITGEVKSCVQHPNADRLRLTKVDIGTGTDLQIVCGASNVAEGQKVIVATVGATLYPSTGEPFTISKSKIRGEVSEGMICAEDEIGAGHSHEGIIVLPPETQVGIPASKVIPIYTDTVFEIGLTPNRGDAASHLGVARDLRAITGLTLRSWKRNAPVSNKGRRMEVIVDDQAACPRYSGLVIKGVKVEPSPRWMQDFLKAIGLNPINNIVDITNYVLHSIGQPIHAFDMEKIRGGKIIVKRAEAGTKFTTLDTVERELKGFELMICNESEPMAMAGVFGGLDSGIGEHTTSIFIESAYFNPATVRSTAKAHGLSTDASFRYERGTDPNITVDAALLAAGLIREIAGGEIESEIVDLYPNRIPDHEVSFELQRFNRLCGKEIPAERINSILQALDIRLRSNNGDRWLLSIPPYRTDVTREADVAEEIMRIYGYNNIEIPSSIHSCIAMGEEEDLFALRKRMGDFLTHSGYNEMVGFSLSSSSLYTDEEQAGLVRILNPLSNELDVLRQQMLFYGLQTIRYNRNRKMNDLLMYEFGKVYGKHPGGYSENKRLAIWISGSMNPPGWINKESAASFYHIKSITEAVLNKSGIGERVTKYQDHKLLDESVQLWSGNHLLAEYGRVKPKLLKAQDIDAPVFYADIDWDLVSKLSLRQDFSVKPVPKFPEVRRDLSMLIDKNVRFEELERVARQTGKKQLRELDVFDVYEGDKLPAGKKSYALSFILQDEERTLTGEQVDKVMQQLMEQFRKQLNAEIRQ